MLSHISVHIGTKDLILCKVTKVNAICYDLFTLPDSDTDSNPISVFGSRVGNLKLTLCCVIFFFLHITMQPFGLQSESESGSSNVNQPLYVHCT